MGFCSVFNWRQFVHLNCVMAVGYIQIPSFLVPKVMGKALKLDLLKNKFQDYFSSICLWNNQL